jgi:hypothetical protein
MRFRDLPLLAIAVPLLALAWSLSGLRAPLPTCDEATPVMIVQSLWHDHDLVYAEADLRRAERVWDGGPAGLTLFTSDGGKTLRYGRPLAYPLAALPFYGILGLGGMALLNMALFLGTAGTSPRRTARPASSRGASSSPPPPWPTPSASSRTSSSWPAPSSRS